MQPRAFKDAVYAELAHLGRGLSNAHRLELLDLLAQGPRTVEELAQGSNRPIANASQHLQVLVRAGLVDRQRQGSFVEYRLAPGVADVLVVLRQVGEARLAALDQARRAYAQAHPQVDAISLHEVSRGLAEGRLLLLDVRPAGEFRHGHIAGARSVPLEELDALLAELPRDREIVACCRGPWCTFAVEAVERLQAAGFQARRFEAGVDDWRLAGGDVAVGAA